MTSAGGALIDRISAAPRVFDPERAGWTMEALAESALGPWLARVRTLLEGVSGCSPYLAALMEAEAEWLAGAMARPPEESMAALLEAAKSAGRSGCDRAALMKALRLAKRRGALLIGLCDIGDVWGLEEVTGALTALGETTLGAALDWLFAQEAARGKLPLDAEDPAGRSGLTALAMGKMGARELNYSSDIDIILFFDGDRYGEDHYAEAKDRFNRIAKDVVRLMAERTGEGYVFRTDLRLRPDPDATPPVLDMEAAEHYYESLGRNWERAAYIKARPCAGDIAAGADFLKRLSPFVWRKHLDFAAIEDVQSMKRLIHAHKGHGEIRMLGHDLKLGRGGIREIEFFAQTQQLISGGRDPSLRDRTTCGALRALTAAGKISEDARAQMDEDYHVLRRVEHRIQMIDDAQTHALPATEDGVERLAAFLGFADRAAFWEDLRPRLERVAARFEALFPSDESLQEEAGGLQLVLEGPDSDDLAKNQLGELGFSDPAAALERIRLWRSGQLKAVRSPRSRAKLERLLPVIVNKMRESPSPDDSLIQFDRFLTGLPAGVQIFSLFESNPKLLEVLAQIFSAAPRLAGYLARHSGVLDAVIGSGFFNPLPGRAALAQELAAILERHHDTDYETTLNLERRWAKERQFQMGAQLLLGLADAAEAGPAFSNLAEISLRALEPLASAEFMRRHGPAPGFGGAVLAMGKLGGREMTATSDLDLIVIYDADGQEASMGEKPLSTMQYYARWTQKFISAVTAPTSEGAVYEVDMRLRPSGRAGPLATALDAFVNYQQNEAWVWEHMALTRARVVAGSPAAAERVNEAIRAILTAPRDAAKVMKDARDMRRRVNEAHPAEIRNPWNLKLTRGGLMDIDYVAQTLLLTSGLAGPGTTGARGALSMLKHAGVLGAAEADALLAASDLQQTLMQIERVALEAPFDPATAAPGLKAAMTRAAGAASFKEAEERLFEAQAAARRIHNEVVGES